MVVVIDYEAGNLYNVGNALNYLGAPCRLTDDPEKIRQADRVILPGVGAAGPAMQSLDERRLVEPLSRFERPFLGICLGLQLLFDRSEEDDCKGFGVFRGSVRLFDSRQLKVPHMGWNTVEAAGDALSRDPLFEGIAPGSYFYFVHSYQAPVLPQQTLGVTEYGGPFSSLMRAGNFWGVQFHPERSGEAGLRLLQNFLDLT